MNYCKIGGRAYDVNVTDIEETFNILYSDQTGRTMEDGAEISLDPIGTFFGHKITFKRKNGNEREFDDLLDYVSSPRTDGIDVEIVHNQSTISYKAYISTGARKLEKIDVNSNKVLWGEFTLNITPMKAQVIS